MLFISMCLRLGIRIRPWGFAGINRLAELCLEPRKHALVLVFRENKNSEKIGARARNTPFGAYCHALTNKEHSRTRSVLICVRKVKFR
uniref:Uncharacterized protein n=1 Tax=Candidatus Kentrum sp. LPFa TaxID=2126335 RepID=A0A450X330_9GAMM|nr:MAG: hypothetical protein BECKLPF1236C_GA0070990_1000722 [Candidatus Kentron sp. LPFa]